MSETEYLEIELKIWRSAMAAMLLLVLSSACVTAPQVSTSNGLPATADGPYKNVLLVVLFSKFDTRRYLEDEIVNDLKAQGIKAVASTSMMTSKTPLTREFVVELMTELGADALLLTQIADLQSTAKVVNMNPQATYNIRPTYYVNVFTMDLTEYIEPQDLRVTQYLSTSSDLYSFSSRSKVWTMITHSKIKENVDHMRDYSIIVREADAISAAMLKDGVVSQ
jgi:hypothetical protein